jgi:glycosyltransferase involved in cell wall biosynthesis
MPWPVAAAGWLLERFLVRILYTGVPAVAISDSTRQGLRRVGLDPANVEVVHPGLDHQLYSLDGVERDPSRLVYLGRLRHYKRLDTLIRLTKDLAPEFPKLRLDVIGIGEDQPFLEGLAQREGVAERVTFHGFVDDETKVRLLREGWVFVMPSLNEGWGISVLEANACGVPAVAFDVAGLNESIRDGETGLLGTSYEDVRAKVRALLSDVDLHNRLARGAVDWSGQFTWDATARELLGVLTEVCPEPQATEVPAPAPQ